MKKMSALMLALSFVFFLAACSSESAAPQAKNQGKCGAGAAKMLRISGYLAKVDSTSGTYSVDGELVASDQVELVAETSGKLIKLYAKDGQKIIKGMTLAKLDDSELQANLKSANATLDLAKKKVVRTKALFEKDGATAEELESAESAVLSAEASRDLILAQLKKTEIRAPFAGVLGIVNVSEGAWLTTGTKIAKLTNVNELKVEFELPQRYSQNVRVGDKVELIDSERGFRTEATVRFVDATLSNTSRTRKIRAALKNEGNKYFVGTYVRVKMNFGNGESVGIPVPTESVTLDANGAYVFIVKNGKAKKIDVKTGLRTPITVDVLSGLAEGDTIIASGLMSVRDGSSVEVKEINNNMNYGVHE